MNNWINNVSYSSPFNGNSDIKSVVIDNGVTSIGDWAFRYCDGLTSVKIGNDVTNPNNRTPSALINVVDPTTTILSAKQVTGAVPFSPLRRGIKQVIAQTEEIEGYIERKYEVELLHEDGSITTEIISIFDEVEEN